MKSQILDLQISEFYRIAMLGNFRVLIVPSAGNFTVCAVNTDHTTRIRLVTQKGAIRHWKSLDTLYKHAFDFRYNGDLILSVDQQEALFA